MLVTDKIIYLQLQKTGCTHIEALVSHFSQNPRTMGKHFRIPPGFDTHNRLILGSIRNPWEWYLSYWTYSSMGKGGPYKRSIRKPSPYKTVFDPRIKNSRGALRRTPVQILNAIRHDRSRPMGKWQSVYNNNDPAQFREWLKLSLDSRRKYDLFQDYGHSPISEFAGLLTYLYVFLYWRNGKLLFNNAVRTGNELYETDRQENLIDAIIRTEHLEEDFCDAMRKGGYSLTDDDISYLNSIRRQNTSTRRFTLDEYYDSECIELVGEKDRFLIEKYRYAPPLHEDGG